MPFMFWAAAGAAAMYFGDPKAGHERREWLRKKLSDLGPSSTGSTGSPGEGGSPLAGLARVRSLRDLETVRDRVADQVSDRVTDLRQVLAERAGTVTDMVTGTVTDRVRTLRDAIDNRGVSLDDRRGPDTPTPAELQDDGAHDRGGWLTLDEAAQQFGVMRGEIQTALREGRISGRRVAGEGIAPHNAPADTVVPEGAVAPDLGPQDDWLVQPEQVERLIHQGQTHTTAGTAAPGGATGSA